MALSDPNDPYGFVWPPPAWAGEQQFDPSAPLVGSIFDIPKSTLVPPDPQMPPPPNPFAVPYDETESQGGANSARFDPERGTFVDPEGNTAFPFGAQSGGTPLTPGHSPIDAPRTDAARIGLFGGPNQAEEIARGPQDETIEMPAEQVGRGTIEMPDDYIGQAPPGFVEMPDEYVGKAPNYGDVDAISGGAMPPQLYDQGVVEKTGRPVAGQTMGKPGEPEEYLTDPELAQKYKSLDPERFEEVKLKNQLAREDMIATEKMDMARVNRERADDNFKIAQTARKRAMQASAEVAADAKKLAETPIDNEAWMNSRSPLQTIAAYVSAIVGGMAASATGGRNVGLDAIQRTIDQHIETQKANLANKRAGLAQRQDAIDNQYGYDVAEAKSLEVQRLAMYEQSARELEIKGQQFDARGTTAIRIADGVRDLRSRQIAAKQKSDQEIYKNELELAKFGLDQDKLIEEQRKNMAAERLAAAKAGAAKAVKPDDVVQPPEYFEAQRLPKPQGPLSQKGYNTWLDNRGKSQTQQNQSLATTHVVPGVTIKGKDGEAVPFVAVGTAESVEKLRVRESSIREIVALIDDARRTRSGWSTDIGNSDEKQQLDAIWGKAYLKAKEAFELGQITGADVGLLKGGLGTDSPSKLRNPLPGMEKARELLIKGVRVDLDAHGYPKDQKYDIPDLQKNAPITTADDGDLKKVLGATAGVTTGEKGLNKITIGPEQQALIDKWEGQAVTGDRGALERLRAAATTSKLATVKAAAAAALQRAAAPNAPTSEEVGGPRGSVAHESAIDQYGLPVEE